ncbi:MAG: hypothetical protein HHJ10_01055, partial [Cellulomonas sp.]|uniref:hypothetical protein n=1 Tax=Cellulomonas sp. TaxID=40001 RepID=UPI0018155182
MAASDNLLVLAPWTAGYYFGEIISGITREAAATGHHVIVAQTLDAGQQTDPQVDAPDFSTRVAWAHVDGAHAGAAAPHGADRGELGRAGHARRRAPRGGGRPRATGHPRVRPTWRSPARPCRATPSPC